MTSLMMFLLLASPPLPAVEYDTRVDFSRYATWSWGQGITPATNPMVDRRIREAIESRLSARGLSRSEKDGALLVVYHASKTTEISLAPVNTPAAATPTGLQYAERASLVVDMLDAASGDVVWRGYVKGVLRYNLWEIAAQVDAAVEKLLQSYPPPAADRVR